MTGTDHLRYLTVRRRFRVGSGIALAGLVIAGFAALQRSAHQDWLRKAPVENLAAEAEAHPEDAELSFALAYRLVGRGHARQAYRIMQKLVESYPRSAAYWDGYGHAAAEAALVPEAVRGYERAAELDPSRGDAHLYLGQIYARAGLYGDAVAELDRAARTGQAELIDPELWTRALLQTGRMEQAWSLLSTTLNKNPLTKGLYPLLVDVAVKLNRWDEAQAMLVRRIDIDAGAEGGVGQSCLARLLFWRLRDPASVGSVQETAKLTEGLHSPDRSALVGRLKLLQGDLPGARASVSEGLRQSPRHAGCLEVLAEVYRRSGRPDLAKQALASSEASSTENASVGALLRAHEASPKDAARTVALARALQRAGRPAEAAELCARVRSPDGRNAEVETLLQTCRNQAIQRLAREVATYEPPLPE